MKDFLKSVTADLIVIILCAVFSAWSLWYMFHTIFEPKPSNVIVENQVDPDTQKQLWIQAHQLTTATRDPVTNKVTVQHRYIPSQGTVSVVEKKDGTLITTVKDKGHSFKVGAGLVYQDTFRLSLDTQLFYWNQAELHLGLAFGKVPVVKPFVAGGWRLSEIGLENTSLIGGKVIDKDFMNLTGGWLVGIRMEF